MRSYILKRILLMIPTLIGLTVITFLLLQFVPGGPVEMEMMKMQAGNQEMGSSKPTKVLSETTIQKLKEQYGFDKPVHVRYMIWIKGVFTGDFGNSTMYSEPVLSVVKERLPISIYFGLIGFTITYIVCIPLGVAKAMRSGSKFDVISSMVVFTGYSIPGWALGGLMLILFGGGTLWEIFPLGGFVSSNFEQMTLLEKTGDLLHHTFLPVVAYLISGFATLTILTKNSVINVLSQDYVRTAYAKGLKNRRIIMRHILRNALIPLATGFGHFLSVLLTGSILIEKIFNIPGIGLLAFDAVIGRDFSVSMGLLVLSSLLLLLGNLITDILYAVADPRIRFE